jgi:hypothetical protein
MVDVGQALKGYTRLHSDEHVLQSITLYQATGARVFHEAVDLWLLFVVSDVLLVASVVFCLYSVTSKSNTLVYFCSPFHPGASLTGVGKLHTAPIEVLCRV